MTAIDLPRDMDERGFQLAALRGQYISTPVDDIFSDGADFYILSGGRVVGSVDDAELLMESMAQA